MKVYVASRLENAPKAAAVAQELERHGHAITYAWWTHGSVQREGPERIREVATNECAGVASADVVVVLLPGGRGTHAELGIAIGLGKRILVVADPADGFFAQDERTCAFYHHPAVTRLEASGDVLSLVASAVAYFVEDTPAYATFTKGSRMTTIEGLFPRGARLLSVRWRLETGRWATLLMPDDLTCDEAGDLRAALHTFNSEVLAEILLHAKEIEEVDLVTAVQESGEDEGTRP